MSALGLDIPARVHPEIVPDSGKKKKKKKAARKMSSDEDDIEVEENEENTDNDGNDGNEEHVENEENEGNKSGEGSLSSDDDSSDSSSDDSNSSSDEEIASVVPPAQAAPSVLKRKISPSGSLQIVVDSDDEIDKDNTLVDICAINVTPLRADASLATPANAIAPLDVLASVATVVEKNVEADLV
nr:histone H2A.Z-specific chaperone chz1-like [Oryza sativa Japonica Group]